MIDKAIRWIIFLMTISFVGLILSQAYWIVKEAQNSEALFDRNVKYALDKVVSKYLEKEFVKSEFWDYVSSSDALKKEKEVIAVHTSKETEKEEKTSVIILETFNKDREVAFMRFEGDSPSRTRKVNISKLGKTLFEDPIEKEEFLVKPGSVLEEMTDSVAWLKPNNETRKNTQVFMDSSNHLLSFRIQEIISGAPDNKNIDFQYLDSVLNQYLVDQGVETDFEFGIWNADKDEMIYVSDKEQKEDYFDEESFRVMLSGRSTENDRVFLYLNFPEKGKYLLGQLTFSLFSSIFLLIGFAGSFFIAFSTILRQRRLSEIKNDFISNMTHEFKTPITNVSLALESLMKFGFKDDPEKSERYLNIAKKENHRLAGQVDKVLQISRIEKENLKLKIKPLNIHEIIEEVVRNYRLQIEKRNGHLETTLQAQLSTVQGDEVHLTNLMANLLDNANKYSPNSPKIRIETENIKDGLLVKVKDEGMGISKEHLSEIFKKFYRVPTGNIHDVKGFGLGLNYVKNIVEKHGGTISVKSWLNKGSEFRIFLPI